MSQFLNHQHFKGETWMTTYETQQFLKVSRRTLFRWCKTKKIPYTLIGGTRYFPKHFIETYMWQLLNNKPFDLV